MAKSTLLFIFYRQRGRIVPDIFTGFCAFLLGAGVNMASSGTISALYLAYQSILNDIFPQFCMVLSITL
jgi:hypothetical protein